MMAICFPCPSVLNLKGSKNGMTRIPTFSIRCNLSITKTELETICMWVKTFAMATVANLVPGFDFLGRAMDGIGDTVTLRVEPQVHPGEIAISDIIGQNPNKLSKDPIWNCAGIAAIEVMKMLGIRSIGLSLSLEKGLTLGSGLGSSVASAGGPGSGFVKSKEKVLGYHADNMAPSIMGGFVLIRSYEPLELIQLKLPSKKELYFVLVTPNFEAPTKKMRAALPSEIGMAHHVWNCSQAGALVASILQGDLLGLGKALSSDKIVELRRSPLIPAMEVVKRAAIEAGTFGCTISGAGPTSIAVTHDQEKVHLIGQHMVHAFLNHGNLKAFTKMQQLNRLWC